MTRQSSRLNICHKFMITAPVLILLVFLVNMMVPASVLAEPSDMLTITGEGVVNSFTLTWAELRLWSNMSTYTVWSTPGQPSAGTQQGGSV